jgi:WD40 repeat protein
MSTLSHRNWARLACRPLEHSNRVTHAMFSADGTRVVTSSADNTASVWDAATGQRLAGPFTHSAEVNTAVFSPDGRLVVTASQDKTARVWDALTVHP